MSNLTSLHNISNVEMFQNYLLNTQNFHDDNEFNGIEWSPKEKFTNESCYNAGSGMNAESFLPPITITIDLSKLYSYFLYIVSELIDSKTDASKHVNEYKQTSIISPLKAKYPQIENIQQISAKMFETLVKKDGSLILSLQESIPDTNYYKNISTELHTKPKTPFHHSKNIKTQCTIHNLTLPIITLPSAEQGNTFGKFYVWKTCYNKPRYAIRISLNIKELGPIACVQTPNFRTAAKNNVIKTSNLQKRLSPLSLNSNCKELKFTPSPSMQTISLNNFDDADRNKNINTTSDKANIKINFRNIYNHITSGSKGIMLILNTEASTISPEAIDKTVLLYENSKQVNQTNKSPIISSSQSSGEESYTDDLTMAEFLDSFTLPEFFPPIESNDKN